MKPLPHSVDAEQAVLSAMLMDPAAIALAQVQLTAESFFQPRHGRIFTAICSIAARGECPDPLILSAQLDGMGELDQVGGKDYIAFLVDAVPTAANIEYHAKIVRTHADRRGLIAVGERMAQSARDLTQSPDTIAQEATSELLPVAAHTRARGFVSVSEIVGPVMHDILARVEQPQGMAGISWGYVALDSETGGQRRGEIAFHCGVPGSGKTALVLNRAVRVAGRTLVDGGAQRVGIVSAEMATKRLVERIINTDARIESKKARKGEIGIDEWKIMCQVSASLKSYPLEIDDTAQPNIRDITAKVKALKAKHPDLSLVVVDFVQLLRDTGDENRSLELTEISYTLQALAKECEVAMDVTCQVDAAAVEKTSDNRPQLHHLRWSQGMREAADFVDLMFNASQYDPGARSVLELSWRKARDLPVFTSYLNWNGAYMLVTDMPVRAVA